MGILLEYTDTHSHPSAFYKYQPLRKGAHCEQTTANQKAKDPLGRIYMGADRIAVSAHRRVLFLVFP